MLFISFIFLIMLGLLSLSHWAKLILYCIFSKVYLSILANSADISSIFFFKSKISASLALSFSSCSFFVAEIVSLFYFSSSSLSEIFLIRSANSSLYYFCICLYWWVIAVVMVTIFYFSALRSRSKYMTLSLISFYAALLLSANYCSDMSYFWSSWTVLFSISTLSASSFGPSPPFLLFLGPIWMKIMKL